MDNLDLMKKRLSNEGGLQQRRMIKDRLKSLKKAIEYSFEGSTVRKLGQTKPNRMMINKNKLKLSSDEKMISIPFEDDYKIGTVFKWLRTDSYWLIYLQDLTENAYFKGYAKKCCHTINWKDDDGNLHSTWVAIEGPQQEKDDPDFLEQTLIQDQPNYILNCYISSNSETQYFIKKYNKFILKDRSWRIIVVDDVSSPDIIYFRAKADWINALEDDVAAGVVGGLVQEIIDPNPQESPIIGETFIRPGFKYTYSFDEEIASKEEWLVQNNCVEILEETDLMITLRWKKSISGSFILSNGEYQKEIIVESLF